MAIALSNDAAILIAPKGTALGSAIDITTLITDADISNDYDSKEITTFGGNKQKFMAGLETGDVNVNGLLDPSVIIPVIAAAKALTGVTRGQVTIWIFFQGQTAGTTDPLATCDAIIKSNFGLKSGEVQTFGFNLKVTNGVTLGLNG